MFGIVNRLYLQMFQFLTSQLLHLEKISKVTCGLLPHSIYLRLLHLMKSCRKMHEGAGKFDLKNDPR